MPISFSLMHDQNQKGQIMASGNAQSSTLSNPRDQPRSNRVRTQHKIDAEQKFYGSQIKFVHLGS